MPNYEYKCENGHIFDVMQSMSDDPLTECTICNASVRKILHPVGISFRGSGFYSTDYSKKGPKGEPKEAAAASSDSSNGTSDSGGSVETTKTKTEPAKKED